MTPPREIRDVPARIRGRFLNLTRDQGADCNLTPQHSAGHALRPPRLREASVAHSWRLRIG